MDKSNISQVSGEIGINIVTVGNSSVGKTCIVNRFVGKPFTESHLTTIGIDLLNYKVEKNGIDYILKFHDTTGQERFATLVSQYFRKADYACFVYAINDTDSFEQISKWIEQLKNVNSNTNLKMILIGNKCDLETRNITFEMGQAKAKELNIPFFETSAKMDINIRNCFNFLFNDIISSNLYKQSKPKQTITLDISKKKKKKNCCGSSKSK